MSNTIINVNDLLEVLSSAILILNRSLSVVYMNQSAEILMRQSSTRAVGLPIQQLISNPAFTEQLQLVSQQSNAQVLRECGIELHGQGTITIDCVITPLNEGGVLLEMSQVDRQLRIVREQQQLNQQQAIHELVRGIAHEIKNPLGGLRGAAQLLQSELADTNLTEYTQIIIAEADRLKALVNSLLGPGKLPKRELINVHEVLEYVRNLATNDAGGRTAFIRDYDPSIPDLLIDRGHLVQVCLNIVNNALRATHYQGTIWLRTRILRQFTILDQRHRLVLKIDICDDGEGIPESMRDKLFLPMVSGHADGSGLGLSIAQSLMRQYGGMIYCDHEQVQTCFSILLPIQH